MMWIFDGLLNLIINNTYSLKIRAKYYKIGEQRMKQKKYEDLTFRDNFMFGLIMRKKEFCIPFLEMILGKKILNIKYADSEKTVDTETDARSIRLDVYIDDGLGTVYDIEMQNVVQPNLGRRFRYYQSVIDTDTMNKGADFDELTNSYIIFICTFDPFNTGLPMYSFESRANEDNSLVMDDGSHRIVLNTTAFERCEDISIQNFLRYIETGEKRDRYTNDIDKAIKLAKENNEGRARFMTMEMALKEERRIARSEGLEEGRAEGRAEGLKEGRVEGEVKVYASIGRSIDEISELVGIPAEKVNEIIKKL